MKTVIEKARELLKVLPAGMVKGWEKNNLENSGTIHRVIGDAGGKLYRFFTPRIIPFLLLLIFQLTAPGHTFPVSASSEIQVLYCILLGISMIYYTSSPIKNKTQVHNEEILEKFISDVESIQNPVTDADLLKPKTVNGRLIALAGYVIADEERLQKDRFNPDKSRTDVELCSSAIFASRREFEQLYCATSKFGDYYEEDVTKIYDSARSCRMSR